MRILFVAMADSVHAARWISQLADLGWDIHLFPVDDAGVHPDLRNVTVQNYLHRKPSGAHDSVRVRRSWPFTHGVRTAQMVARKVHLDWRERDLSTTIRRLEPDIVHSLEFQHAGYLTLAARRLIGDSFPTWMVANWGSDIFLFGRLQEHVERIKSVLSLCDYYGCECRRDLELARTFGFRGQALPILPNGGGFDIERMRALRSPGPTSSRRVIALKGYQTWAGRALVALRAIELAADALHGYSISIFSPSDDVRIAAELVERATRIPIEIMGKTHHEDILRLHGRARMSIGLSISDAASTSMLEASVMGSFPIQSSTSCADEWIQHGRSGLIVPPEDPSVVADAIRRAATDDGLVDSAERINAEVAASRLGYSYIRQQAVEMYERAYAVQRS